MAPFTYLTVHIGLALMCARFSMAQNSLVAPNVTAPSNPNTAPNATAAKPLFDFALTPDMKETDFDDPTSVLGKLIKYVVKGQNKKNSDYLSLHTVGKLTEMVISIKNDSIFVPGDNVANTQNGFRRTDVLPAIDVSKTLVGTTVFHTSVRGNPKGPLNLKHGYLLASIEIPSGDHVFDIFTGSDFSSDDKAPVPTNNSQTIRVRDLTTKVLYSAPFDASKLYNFAVAVDWTANTLTVYASEGNNDLKMVAGPSKNDPKAIAGDALSKGEWHVQLIKFPLPNPADPVAKRSDVPHFGLQEGTTESASFSRIFVEDGAGGAFTASVTDGGHFGKEKHGGACRV